MAVLRGCSLEDASRRRPGPGPQIHEGEGVLLAEGEKLTHEPPLSRALSLTLA